MNLSVIIPAYNEEGYLPQTLRHIEGARDYLARQSLDLNGSHVEILVVDNSSTDRTAALAQELGAQVVQEPVHNIARVRNAGAGCAAGDILVFIDADTLIPETLLWRIVQVLSDPNCIGGAVDTEYRSKRPSVRLYLCMWRLLAWMTSMAQGATQFCRRDAYCSIGGYDATLFMGEDVDFYWRLRKLARAKKQRICFLSDIRVKPSGRRYEQCSLLRILVCTNPVYAWLLCHKKEAWPGWYIDVPR